jgi:hypothetical protein
MVKRIVLTAPCGANAVVAGDFLETDGAGAVKAFDGTGTPLGIAASNKDTENNVGCIKQGIVNIPSAAATYSFGDVLDWDTGQTVKATVGGVVVGTAAETKTTTSGLPNLAVYVNFA